MTAVGAAAFLAACGGDSKDETQGSSTQQAAGTAAAQQEGTPKPGGQLREATITQAPHFSPYHPGADPSFVNSWRRSYGYYDALWGFRDVNQPDRLHPRLAASYEQPDETTVIAKLKDAVWHNRPPVNGRAVTAEDVVQRIEFVKKPPASGGARIQSG
ncbi:MAG: hypothetical protein ACRDJ9_22565 [Dehalococcoidia bacterium]